MDTTYDQQTEKTFKAEYSDLVLGPSLQGTLFFSPPLFFVLFHFLFTFTVSLSFLSPFFVVLLLSVLTMPVVRGHSVCAMVSGREFFLCV